MRLRVLTSEDVSDRPRCGRMADWPITRRVVHFVSRGVRHRLALGQPAGEPAWSPDGRRLAFISRGDVYSVRAGGRGLRRLTTDGTNSGPSWSVRGRLAFVHAATLVVAQAGGTHATTLTDRVVSADWAPDGRHLVVVRRAADANQFGELWVLGA